ncbi:uncharacterized protein LOC144702886 [Wolffia australiana]
MTLIAYQANGCARFTLKTRPCSRAMKLKYFVDLPLVRRSDKYASLNHRFNCRVRPTIFPKEKHFKVSSFKANDHGDVERVPEKQAQLPLSPETVEEAEIGSTGSTVSSVGTSALNGETTQVIEGLFKRWLSAFGKNSDYSSTNEAETRNSNSDNPAKSFLLWFLSLDAALKIPLLIFIPWYVMIRVTYGIEVTRELTPLWTIGPLIAALYIKTVQAIISLYAFCFKKGAGVLENLPYYCTLVQAYLMEGKLRDFLYARFMKPIVDVKNADYNALSKQKLKHLREWAVEKYLDYVESIWPYYCRTIRFLKRANLL